MFLISLFVLPILPLPCYSAFLLHMYLGILYASLCYWSLYLGIWQRACPRTQVNYISVEYIENENNLLQGNEGIGPITLKTALTYEDASDTA